MVCPSKVQLGGGVVFLIILNGGGIIGKLRRPGRVKGTCATDGARCWDDNMKRVFTSVLGLAAVVIESEK